MCGISGIVDPDRKIDLHFTLHEMLEIESNRGPDGKGEFFYNGVAIGHRLLRIIDCQNSRQPMKSSCGSYIISFNGEIYNYNTLRNLSINSVFQTKTDTEVILNLYKEIGSKAFSMLDGMFAIAIYDKEKQEIILAKDKFGQKPLYYKKECNIFSFSSSIRSLIFPKAFQVSVDKESIYEYLWTLDCFENRTLYKNVCHVEPGTVVRININTLETTYEQFADARFNSGSSNLSIDSAVKNVESLIRESIGKVSQNVPRTLAVHLSGGLDSSTIVAYLNELSEQLVSYSCTYSSAEFMTFEDEKGFEEGMYAKHVADNFQIENQQILVKSADYLKSFYEVISIIEEPKGNPCLPHFKLAQAIGRSRKHSVCLGGEGADEMFGGYPWKLESSLNRDVDIPRSFFNKLLPTSSRVLSNLFGAQWLDKYEIYSKYEKDLDLNNYSNSIDAIMSYDLKHFLRYLLNQSEKLNGRFSIEGRYPFLDYSLTDYLLKIPAKLRFSRRNAVKPVLRRAVEMKLPTLILERPKIGFVAPEGSWYRYELYEFIDDILFKNDNFLHELVDISYLKQLIFEHRVGKSNYRKLIWAMLSLSVWHKVFIEKTSDEVNFQKYDYAQLRC
jgi:asparagine synthase (glutamine-hydrolysing)